jgi:hypothetical protein
MSDVRLRDDEAIRFDELLVQPADVQDPVHRRRETWLKRIGVTLIIGGSGFLVFFLFEFVRMYFVFNRNPGMHFAQFYGLLGETISGSVALMGLGGIVYSFVFLAEQVRAAREAHLQQDMPIVFVAPRLFWDVGGVSNGRLNAKNLFLYVGVRNVGDAAATHIKIGIQKLTYQGKDGDEQEISIPGLAKQAIDYLPGKETTVANRYRESMEWLLTEKCPGLLDAMFHYASADDDLPALKMHISVSFRTIRGAAFCSCGSASWSPKQCRDTKLHRQSKFLCDFAVARNKFDAGKGGLDRFFGGAEDNPLITIVEMTDKDKCDDCK